MTCGVMSAFGVIKEIDDASVCVVTTPSSTDGNMVGFSVLNKDEGVPVRAPVVVCFSVDSVLVS